MSRPATSRLKVNELLGRMPTLQFCRPAELLVDPAYQRDTLSSQSQTLIRRIAQFWNWDLCQPLVVARRVDLTERLFVIDGQHRLLAARLRGDIDQLPCVIVTPGSVADEAASFVHLNQQRRPLTKLDVFKAAVASGDEEAAAIVAAMVETGLSIAPHSNHSCWKPGMVSNIGGIQIAWRRHGPGATQQAFKVLASAFEGQVLQFAGTIFPAIVAVCGDHHGGMDAATSNCVVAMLRARPQAEWRRLGMAVRASGEVGGYTEAITHVIRQSLAKELARPAPVALPEAKPVAPPPPPHAPAPTERRQPAPKVERPLPPKPRYVPQAQPAPHPRPAVDVGPVFDQEGKTFCQQCDKRVARGWAKSCIDKFCKAKVAA